MSISQFFGNQSKTFIVAEIGINHNGDMELAREMIFAAAKAGADSVKFQNYFTEDFISDRSLMFSYQSSGKRITESQYDMFKRCELGFSQLQFLKDTCDKAGVIFHSTPTSLIGIKQLLDVGCKILKNGSDCLTNLRLVRAMGESGLLTVLSTGMACLSEIEAAVQTFRATGNDNLILLHCTSAYPTPPDQVNLSRIKVLSDAFGVKVGFSDHSEGNIASVCASFLGAKWIEKHFTIDKTLPGPDHWFSMNSTELSSLVASIRSAEQLLGSSQISPTSAEQKSRTEFRLSCVAARDLVAGHQIKSDDITFHRPGDGISPLNEQFLCGSIIRQPILKGEKFTLSHLHGNATSFN